MTASTKKQAVVSTKVTKEHVFPLGNAEVAKMAREASQKVKDIAKVENEFEEKKQVYKSRIADLSARRDDILNAIHEGEEKRSITCTMIKDFEAKTIRFEYAGKVIETRAMTGQELQMEMKLQEKKDSGKKSKKQPIDQDVAGVIKSETSRKTKSSSVDGARA